jgi:hypothetical protein
MPDKDVARVNVIVALISRHLAGEPAQLQGAVLADLLATWLASHHVEGNADATLTLRAELLAMHCSAVRQLVPINAEAIGTTP